MKQRRLSKEEHFATRPLWEEIFTEDDKQFLDYYYSCKTKENEIYVVEEEEKLCSMLHLNPYMISVNNKEKMLHYIVAVATKEAYRGRGYMAALLKRSAGEMYQRQEPFTFLMPAAEAIYAPHGFRFIYRQTVYDVPEEEIQEVKYPGKTTIRYAREEECGKMAAFAEQLLGKEDVVRAKRTDAYYQMLLKEQKSENGGILLFEEEGSLAGMVLVASDGRRMEVREPLFERPELLSGLLSWMKEKNVEEAKIAGIPKHIDAWMQVNLKTAGRRQIPVIMARIIHLKTFLECLTAEVDFTEVFQVKDRMLRENTGTWKITGKENSYIRAEKISEEAGDDAYGIEDLTVRCFGCRAEETEGTKEKKENLFLRNIRPLCPVFLNEIV